jgi:phosphatidylserine decarboxylase
MFKLHKEGRNIIIVACILITAVGLLLLYLVPQPFRAIGGILLLILLFLILYFFRVPSRAYTLDEGGNIISPCDGKVVVIEDVEEQEYLQKKCTQISIFMSPLNVHINWYPCNGKVVYTKHHNGKYLVAWHPKSSLENERTTTVIDSGTSQILVRQIAGAVARRIINYAKVGSPARLGEQLGFIKFGSRVDVFVPVGSQIKVSLEEVVKGGQTVLARIG